MMWAWSRSSRRSAPPGDLIGRGSIRQFSSSASILLDRLDVVSLGPPRHGGLRLARELGEPRVR
eukprot:4217911-Pleurochrysis_carterae.AAC.1